MRLGKGGKEIWIQASCNPIRDLNDQPFKVVKYATDVTTQVTMRNNMKELIVNVTESVKQFAESSETVSATSQSLSVGAQSQSASVEEIGAQAQTLRDLVESFKIDM